MERLTSHIFARQLITGLMIVAGFLLSADTTTAQESRGTQEAPPMPPVTGSPGIVDQPVNWATVVKGGEFLVEAPPPTLPLEVTPKPPLPPAEADAVPYLNNGDIVTLAPDDPGVVDLFRTIRTDSWYPKVSLGENATYYAVMEYDAGSYNGFTVYKNNGDPSVTAWTWVISLNNIYHSFDFADIEIVSSADRGYVIFHRQDGSSDIDCYWWQLSNPANFGESNIGTTTSTTPYCSITSDEVEYNGDAYLYACWKSGNDLIFKRSTDNGLTWGSQYTWTGVGVVSYMMTGNSITYCPGDNHVFIALTDNNNDVRVLESSSWGAAPWTTTTVMSNAVIPFTGGGIASSYGNYILVSAFGPYPVGPDNNLAYVVSSNAGTSWSLIQAIGGAGDQNYPSCAASDDGYVSMFYYDAGEDQMESMRATYVNQVWSVYDVDPTNGYNTVPSACIEDGYLPDHGGAWSRGLVTNPSYFGWGSLPLCVTLIPHNPPIVIPAQGGNFTYDVYVHNNDAVARTFDVWVVGIKPNGQETPLKFGPVNQTLQPGQVYSALNLVQQVPAWVPAGTYTWLAKIGTYPNFVTDTDRFTAIKSAVEGNDPWSGWQINGDDPFQMPIAPDQAYDPEIFSLLKVQPNPFNPTTVLSFELRAAGLVRLSVYDLSGRRVAELINDWREAGSHQVTFDGSNLPSGIYLYRLSAGESQAVGKMVLMK